MTVDTKQYPGFANLDAMGSDANVIKFLMTAAMSKLNTSMPVEVLSVKTTGIAPVGYVNIRILVDQITADGKTHQYGEIPNVPYFRLQGGNKAVIIDPEVGDIGMACFCSRDISAMKNARKGAPPGSRRMYDISDALYVGGFLNKAPTHYIQFTDGGIIVSTPGSVTVNAATLATINAPTTKINGNLEVSGNTTMQGNTAVEGSLTNKDVNVGYNHTHAGSPTAPNGPVSNTGTPI